MWGAGVGGGEGAVGRLYLIEGESQSGKQNDINH